MVVLLTPTFYGITEVANYTSVCNQTHVRLSENLDLYGGFRLNTGAA